MRFCTIPARDRDIRAIHDISVQCGLSTWTEADFSGELRRQNSILIVGISEVGRVLGFIHGRIIPARESDESQAEIYNVATKAEFRRHGVAGRLLTEFIEECRSKQVQTVLLEVRASNTAAIDFYRKMGFWEIGLRKNFYSAPPEHALSMSLVLEQGGDIIPKEFLKFRSKLG